MYTVMKLVTGEEIIAKYILKNETCAYLQDPLVVKYRYGMSGPPTVTLAKFSVFATERQAEIKLSNIVAEFEPIPLLIEYYSHMVEYLDMMYANSMVEDLETGIESLKQSMKKFSKKTSTEDTSEKTISIDEMFGDFETPKGKVH